MATADALKQSINASFRKAVIEPFQPMKARLKFVPSAALATIAGVQDDFDAPILLQYETLDSSRKTVRLLEILPGRDFEPISATLSIYDLDEKPEYIALSYMWNQGDLKKYIDCQGARIEIGENLWQFLRQCQRNMSMQLHHEENPAKPLRLWIDAISINQNDIEERNHQVAMMRDIYTSAESIIVWLGLAEGDDELAFLLTRYPRLIYVEEMLSALVNLLNKSYWSRVWVVQEVVLARKVDIWCGGLQAELSMVESIWQKDVELNKASITSSRIINTRGYTLFQKRKAFRHSRVYRRDILGRRNSKTLKATFRLRDLLETFDVSQSSEPFDKIYAFLGIASKGRGRNIRPDYSVSGIALLVDVLENQCHNAPKRGEEDNYKFLHLLRRTLRITRMDLASYILQKSMNIQPYIYVVAASEFMAASVTMVSTVLDIGHFVDEAEAFAEGTWKTTWTRPTMHPRSLSNQDIHDLGQLVQHPETGNVLSFAEPHIPGAPYLGRAEMMRRSVIAQSTELVIQQLIEPSPLSEASSESNAIGKRKLRAMFASSMLHANELHAAARPALNRRNTDHRYERYASFVGTEGITGLICISGASDTYQIGAGDRICTFSGVTDSNNAFVVRLDPDSKWAISGFARILLPERRSDWKMVRGAEPAVNTLETDMCFHCHLTDLLELQRCQILNDVQMERLLKNTLRGQADDEVHKCKPGPDRCDILEFGF